MPDKVPVSVVVLTKNDEVRIARTLESVKWADEVIVVDDESTDQTLSIVKQYADRVFVRKMVIQGTHRNWAYAQARNLWVLSLDSDEVVTPELRDEIAQVLKGNPSENGFTIPRRNYIGDHWVRYGGWYPSPQLRLFRKDKFRYEEVTVHPRAFMDDPCGHLKFDVIHYTYRDLDEYLRKLNRQTTNEAQKWLAQNKPMRLGVFIWRTIDRFMRAYVGKKGYKDGFVGFVVAYFSGLYQVISYLKYRELLRNRSAVKAVFLDRDGVINAYPGDKNYVTSWDRFNFLPGVFSALDKLTNKEYKIFVISNQAGVSKGVYSEEELDLITRNMLAILRRRLIEISGVYYCLHRPEDNCSCRKPKAGLIDMAADELKKQGREIDLAKSYFVGDTIRDVETGKAAGLKTILVFSGKEKKENKNSWESRPDFTARDLSEAVHIILRCRK